MSARSVAAVALAAAGLAGCGAGHADSPRPAVVQISAGGEVATGFALGPGRVVTVAHVLSRRRRGAAIRLLDGRRATIATVDQRDDLAVLAVPGLRAPRTTLGSGHGDVMVLVVRNDRVRALPARIRRRIVARIRTPDGRRVVRRRALVLRADVQQGDSGAPVLTADGRVAGVVFAQSDLQDDTAYAVDARALAGL